MASDAEQVLDMLVKEFERQGVHEHELAIPLVRFGTTWLMFLGPHTEEMCWCQPVAILCPWGAHAHVLPEAHKDRVH